MTQPMGHKPMVRQRSVWTEIQDANLPKEWGSWFMRNVSDGMLRCLVAHEPPGWHLSVSFVNHKGEPSRYPTWDEQVDAVRNLLPSELTYAMFITPDDEFVALHQTTFHWHEAVQ